MKYRRLGTTGLKVSVISLGSWLTYGNSTDRETAIQTIDKAYSLGVNFFDTANVYAQGEAERVVGEALRRYPRESYVLASKVYFPMGKGPNDRGLSRKHIMEQANASLKRLGVDYLDIYYCHRYDPDTPLEETMRALDDLVHQGKVLYLGFSEWTAAQIMEAMRISDNLLLNRFVVSQPSYNLLNRQIENEIVPVCLKNGIGLVPFSPLAQGVLTGKYRKGQAIPAESRAADPKANMFIKRYLNDEMLDKVEKLIKVADEAGLSLATMSLAWLLHQPGVSSTLTGASRPSQIEENVKAAEVELSSDLLDKIDEIVK